MESRRFIWIFLVLGVLVASLSSISAQYTPDDLVVEAGDLGKIQGRNTTTTGESLVGTRKPYIQFLGIPYANYSERFQPSILLTGPLNSSGDTFVAFPAGPQCYQPASFPIIMSEDCLSLNVYTPRKFTGNESELLPVLFFIHGGAFTVGSGSQFSAIRMLNRDVVYVTVNYRLGIAGFYSLQNADVPGNAAMYDVVNALKWTSLYIKHFGGNPNLVTIAGQSAGSATVTHLLASPMASGLFHRAIAASGSGLNAWATTSDPMKDSTTIATMANCHNSTINPVLDKAAVARCMRALPMNDIVNLLYDYQVSERRQGRLGFAVVSPVVQNFPMAPYSPFAPEHPSAVFSRGGQANVPLLMGNTKHDGSYVLGVFYNRFIKDNGLENNATFLEKDLVPAIFQALDISDSPPGIYDSLTHAYIGESRTSGDLNKMYPGLMDLCSVFFFKAAGYQTALYHSRLNSTYWYSFDYKGPSTLYNQLFGAEVPPFPGGVTHTDDLIYLYLLTFQTFNEDEYAVSSRMLDYWANFAATGNPTPPGSNLTPWPALDEEAQMYMSIDKEAIVGSLYSHKFVGPGYETVPAPQVTTTTVEPPVRITTTQRAATTGSSVIPTTPKATATTEGNSGNVIGSSVTLLLLIISRIIMTQ